MRLTSIVLAVLFFVSCAAQTSQRLSHRWTKFIQVEGQPEAIPAEWVETPEGKFAHSIKVPNSLPKNSGYHSWMSSEQYFNHLCKSEAGEFVYRAVDNVEGFYYMRPPRRPTDIDLMDRFKLEDPYTERFYQLQADKAPDRPAQFVNPPFNLYRYVEEPRRNVSWQALLNTRYLRAEGYRFDSKVWKVVSEMKIEGIDVLVSRYGYTWRGIKRDRDRDNAIAGSELIVLDLRTSEVLGLLRNFAISPKARNTPDGIWWLNARSCPQFPSAYQDTLGQQIYQFVSKVLKPIPVDK